MAKLSKARSIQGNSGRGRNAKNGGGWFSTSFRLVDVWVKVKEWILHQSRKQTIEYFESSTINAYQYIVDYTLTKWERRMWRLVHLVALCVAIWVMWQAGGQAILTPVAVSRTPVGAPVTEVPHPAIALCSLNRISKWRAMEFAAELISSKSLNYTLDEMVDMLGYLGLAYDLEIPSANQLDVLHSILEPYNLDHLLKRLTPSCDEFIKKCQWRGALVNCSSIFTTRKTMEGYCCAFNYRRHTDTFISNVTTTKSENATIEMARPGIERGLSVVIDPKLDDYMYTRYPHEGTKSIVFNPQDYPDIISGSCVQQSLAPVTELYVNLEAILLTAKDDVKGLSTESRGCIAASDSAVFVDSFSDCVVSCRMRSVLAACGCIPFYLPAQYDDHVCTLLDNVCLKKWRADWFNAWSGEEALVDKGEIAGDARAPPCFYCLPACEEAVYRARQHAVNLQPATINSQPDSEKAQLKQGIVFKDHSVIHIYFSKDSMLHLEYGLLSKWYDLLSAMGGICGLFLGASVISLIEFGYFVIGGPATRTKHRRQAETRQLYWEELRNYKMR